MEKGSKWEVFLKFLKLQLKKLNGKEGRKSVRARRMNDARRTKLSESTKQDSYELIKTDTVRTGPNRICVTSSASIA